LERVAENKFIKGGFIMFGKSTNNRFEVVYQEGTLSGYKVIVDKATGVNYLYCWDGYGGGITPLLDRDGKPVVTSKNY
jgi:hypothetical protein